MDCASNIAAFSVVESRDEELPLTSSCFVCSFEEKSGCEGGQGFSRCPCRRHWKSVLSSAVERCSSAAVSFVSETLGMDAGELLLECAPVVLSHTLPFLSGPASRARDAAQASIRFLESQLTDRVRFFFEAMSRVSLGPRCLFRLVPSARKVGR